MQTWHFFCSFPGLRTLRLNGDQFTEASVHTLTQLPDLREVYLAGTAVSVESIERLATMSNITLVGLMGTQVPEPCSAALKKFPNLEGVAILPDTTGPGGGTPPLITDPGLALLVEIPTLKSIELGPWQPDYRSRAAECEEVATTREVDDQLRTVGRGARPPARADESEATVSWGSQSEHDETPSPSFTDAGLQNLSSLTQLEQLDSQGGNFTDAGIAHLSGLTNLTLLHLERFSCRRPDSGSWDKLTNLTRFTFVTGEYDGPETWRVSRT